MQLKRCLLIGFVLNVFCLNNLSGEFLRPKYDLRKNESLLESLKKDPLSFVELFAKADPEKINVVLGLLDVLAVEASSALDLLHSHVNDRRIRLETAGRNVVEANSNVVVAQSALEQADSDHTSALNDQTNAVNEEQSAQSAKAIADQNYAEQSPSLLEEQRVIQNVIQILGSLIGVTCPYGYTNGLCEITSGQIETNTIMSGGYEAINLINAFGSSSKMFHGVDSSTNEGRCWGSADVEFIFTFTEVTPVNMLKFNQQGSDRNVTPRRFQIQYKSDGNWVDIPCTSATGIAGSGQGCSNGVEPNGAGSGRDTWHCSNVNDQWANDLTPGVREFDFSAETCVVTDQMRILLTANSYGYSSMGRVYQMTFFHKKSGSASCG